MRAAVPQGPGIDSQTQPGVPQRCWVRSVALAARSPEPVNGTLMPSPLEHWVEETGRDDPGRLGKHALGPRRFPASHVCQ